MWVTHHAIPPTTASCAMQVNTSSRPLQSRSPPVTPPSSPLQSQILALHTDIEQWIYLPQLGDNIYHGSPTTSNQRVPQCQSGCQQRSVTRPCPTTHPRGPWQQQQAAATQCHIRAKTRDLTKVAYQQPWVTIAVNHIWYSSHLQIFLSISKTMVITTGGLPFFSVVRLWLNIKNV